LASYLPRVPLLILIAWLVLPVAAQAQERGLPAFSPINPMATSRSGLAFEPYRAPRPGRWSGSISLDYASTIEVNQRSAATYFLDSELLRVRLDLARDLTPRVFLKAGVEVDGSYAGFLDGFLHWYHNLLGGDIAERDERPRSAFLYEVALPGRAAIFRRSSDLFLGDIRVGGGFRLHPGIQSVAYLTLPTSTGPDGYGRGVVSWNLVNTLRAQLGHRLIFEASFGLGYTPTHGDLASIQRETMVSASSGLRFRAVGRHSVYANLFYHSPYYRGSTLPALDRHDLSLDFGWSLARKNGGDWRIGMTEDLLPSGPAVDLIFRLGWSF
jgi:Protein of unknown function (DUF3187)